MNCKISVCREAIIAKILKELCASAYWYGEDTGDYDMLHFGDTVGFKSAVQELERRVR